MTTPPPPALPEDPEVRPDQIKDAPYYWPNLIAALAASIAVAVGSIGPWIAFMGMSRNNIGDGADGTITLILGIIAALCLFALLNFGRTQVRSKRMIGLGTVAGIAGGLAFLIAVIDAQEVSSRKTEIMGKTIGPEIGWGLWMILIAGPVLAITSGIVVKQVMTIAKTNAAGPEPQRYRIKLGGAAPAQPVPPAPAARPTPPASAPAAPQPAVTKHLPPQEPPTPVPPAPSNAVPNPPAPAPPPLPPPAPPAPAMPQRVAEVPHPTAPVTPVPTPPAPPAPPPPTVPAIPTPPPASSDGGRSRVRRAAPWVGGAAALAAALAAGVWAGPYLTGSSKDTGTVATASSTTTTTTTAAPSTTTSTSAAAAASGSSAPATFGPFTSGDAKVFVDGQPREVRGDVSCLLYSGKATVSVGPIGNPVVATITEADSRVNSVSLGNVDGVVLAYLDGAANGTATATKDGKTYRITGTASGVDMKNPMQPYTRPFEITITCP